MKKHSHLPWWLVCLIAGLLLSPSAALAGDAYLLGTEDVLEIAVWKDKELSRTVGVRPDGMVSFPLIGEVAAGGRTVAAVEQEISTRLGEYVSHPVVTVMVRKIKGKSIFVVGKVNRPGASNIVGPVNVMQALALAGGLTPYASESGILILRTTGTQSRKISFNYAQVKRGMNIEQNIWLEDGDVIVVR